MKNYILHLFLFTALFLSNYLDINAQNVLWAKKGSSEGFENGNGITCDDSGNVYVTGQTEFSANYDSHILNSWGSHDILVAKYSTDGSISWIHNAGGRGGDVGHGIGVDSLHNTFIIGEIEDTVDFGSGISAKSNGANDIFIAKYNTVGNISWAKGFGSSGNDKGEAIVVTPSGDCYMTGYFSSGTNFDGTTLNSTGGYDIFIIKTNSSGQVQWAKKAGGEGNDRGNGIAIDALGNIYVTGTFYQSATFNNTTISCPTKTGTFLAKYNSTGQFQWATAAGSCCDTTKSNSISLDENGNVYLTGYFKNETKFGSYNFTANGTSDIFLVKYDPSGNVVWAKQAGGNDDDGADGICVDNLNHLIYITGQVHSNGYFDSLYYQIIGFMDVFVAAYNLDGEAVWLKTYGGHYRDAGAAVTVDKNGYIYSTGLFNDIAEFGSITLTGYPNQPWADFYVDKILPPLANSPVIQATAISITSGHCSDLNLTLNPGNGNKRIIIARENAEVNSFPTNGNSYFADSVFGNGSHLGNGNYIIYNGAGNNVTLTNLTPGKTYYFSVFEYNGIGITSNFLTSNSAIGNASSAIFPINITSLQNSICSGDSLVLITSGANSYSWSPSMNLNIQSDSSVNVSPYLTTTYTVTGKNSDGCYAESKITILVNPLPIVSFSTQNSICLNNLPLSLTGGLPLGGIYSGNGVNGGQFFPSATGSGTFPLTYTFTNENGCTNNSQTSIRVHSTPGVILSSIPNLCANESPITLSNGIPAGGIYTGTGVNAGMFYPSIGQGAYQLTYSYTNNNGCTGISSVFVVVKETPTINLGNDLISCAENSVILSAGNSYAQYNWSTGETTPSISTDSSGTGIGLKKISIVVKNSFGCSNSDTIQIIFDLCAGINTEYQDINNTTLFPNPFNRKINLTTNITSTICVFDIYGKLVQKISDVSGTISMGESLHSGIYFVQVISTTNKKMFSVIKSEY